MLNILKRSVNVLRQRQHMARFSREYGSFYGVFGTLEEALAFGKSRADINYNRTDVPLSYKERMDNRIPPNTSDYPLLYWLEKICGVLECGHIFDVGGSVGVHYDVLAPRLRQKLHWTVCELPETVALGRQVASERAWTNVRFTTRFAEAEDADVLLASGSLQYIQEGFLEQLRGLTRRPPYMLLGKVPLYGGQSFYTLQNAGVCLCPAHIFNKEEFLGALNALGYRPRDLWEDPSRTCHLPYAPENSFSFFYGLFLERTSGRPSQGTAGQQN